MKLKDKTVLITGGSGGIGQAVSSALAREGAKLICFDLKLPDNLLDQTVYRKVDITSSSQIIQALREVDRSIDILINNAGIMRRGTLLETSEEDFDTIFKINFKGSWLMLKLAQRYLNPKATIVQMSSRHGLSLPINPAIYGLSKNAVISLMEVLKKTYPHYNLKLLYPGPIDTPLSRYGLTPEALKAKLKIMISPEDFAEKLITLLKEDKEKLIFDEESWSYKYE